MFVHISKKSANVKTGKMPVTTSDQSSCPTTCPHHTANGGGCYAASGPLSWHWKKVSNGQRGGSWSDLTNFVSGLEAGTMYRHNQSGDFFYDTDDQGRELINLAMLKELVDANKSAGAKGYTYTHHKLDYVHNLEAVKYANRNGFTVNASCETLEQADSANAEGIPSVCVVDNTKDVPKQTPAGTRVVVCPAQRFDSVDCKSCGLCQQSDRKFVVAFLAHGNGAKKVNSKLSTFVHNSKEVA